MIPNVRYLVLTALLTVLMPAAGQAQSAAAPCVQVQSAQVIFDPKTDEAFYGNTMSALNIANAKKAKYNEKMPMQLGNIGEARVSVDGVSVTTKGDPATGCVTVDEIRADFILKHFINIASEYEEGTCVHTALFEIEDDLQQQDQEIANQMIQDFRLDLTMEFGAGQERIATPGTNIDTARGQVEAKIEQRIRDKAAEIAEKLFNVRRQSDLPTYYDEILKECAGQQ